jgi:uncharacterized protein YndB with AHSA1/START domain
MKDLLGELNAVRRTVGTRAISAGEGQRVVLRRHYEAEIEDVWDALTTAERISRWLLPVTGDLREGGTYQLQGYVGGRILRCEPPSLLAVTWIGGENPTDADISEVVVRLTAAPDGRTEFELEHTAVVEPAWWAEFGPGSVGIGWDLSLLGLALHLSTGEDLGDPEAYALSPEIREFMTHSSHEWGTAFRASGAEDAAVAVAVENVTRFYVPDLDPEPVDARDGGTRDDARDGGNRGGAPDGGA